MIKLNCKFIAFWQNSKRIKDILFDILQETGNKIAQILL